MALYHQLKFPSTFIEYRSVSEWKGVVVISNFVQLRSRPFKSTALGSCLVCLDLNSPLSDTISEMMSHAVTEICSQDGGATVCPLRTASLVSVTHTQHRETNEGCLICTKPTGASISSERQQQTEETKAPHI